MTKINNQKNLGAQTPKKTTQGIHFGCWNLVIVWSLVFGFWFFNAPTADAAFTFNGSYSDDAQAALSLPFDTIHSIAPLDLGGDRTSELVFGSPVGQEPKVHLTRLDGSIINEWYAYDENFKGGVFVTSADLDGDGVPEIITAPSQEGGAHVRVFDGYGNPKGTPGFFAEEVYVGTTLITTVRTKTNGTLIVALTNPDRVPTMSLFSSTGELVEKNAINEPLSAIYSLERIDLGDDGYDELLIAGATTNGTQNVYLLRTDGSSINSFQVSTDDMFVARPTHKDGERAGGWISINYKNKTGADVFDGYGTLQHGSTGIQSLAGVVTIDVLHAGEGRTLNLPYRANTMARDGKVITIDLSEQKLSYFEGGFRIATITTSTGKPGYETPTGEYAINNKVDRAYSRAYGLYMPYWMSFIGSAYGIHELPEWPSGYKEGEDHLGKAVSHGCVRLGVGAAEELYQWADVGTPVVVQK